MPGIRMRLQEKVEKEEEEEKGGLRGIIREIHWWWIEIGKHEQLHLAALSSVILHHNLCKFSNISENGIEHDS